MLKVFICVSSALVAAVLIGMGQPGPPNRIDLKSQTQNVDFSGFPFTRPVKVGTALPANCGVGDLFFKTDAPAGQNLYGCPNGSWVPEGAAGVSTGSNVTVGAFLAMKPPCQPGLFYLATDQPRWHQLYVCGGDSTWVPTLDMDIGGSGGLTPDGGSLDLNLAIVPVAFAQADVQPACDSLHRKQLWVPPFNSTKKDVVQMCLYDGANFNWTPLGN